MSTPWALLRADDLPHRPAGGAEPGRWWRFTRPAAVLRADRPDEVPALLDEVEAAGRWAVGFVAYEAAPGFDPALRTHPPRPGVPAAWFALFPQPEPSDGPPEPAPAADGAAPEAPLLAASLSERAYLDRLAAIRRAIARGDTYQVNFSYRLRGGLAAAAPGPAWEEGALELFAGLCRSQSSRYAAFLHLGPAAVCSASPELFFRRTGPRIECRPMKGTAPRGRTRDEDRRLGSALRASPKERAENLMIVDMVRNDLGRIARPGTVRVPALFEVERYETVLQMTSSVEAESPAPLSEVFRALFPCGSVTGAPKVSTMGLVAELEDGPRGVYTGAVGVVAPNGDARFSVAIRTAWAEGPAAAGEPVRIEYGTGGGIVWDSHPARELSETRLKAEALHRALRAPAPDFELLETLLWTPGEGYRLLDRHLARLADSGDYFGIPVDPAEARRRLEAAARELPGRPHRVRLLCDRRGRLRLEAAATEGRRIPIRVRPAPAPVDPRDVFLFHKTTRREVYARALDRARAEARAEEGAPEIDDVVLWNERGELTEATLANLVLELDGERVTPPVECGLLAGTFRAELLHRGHLRERVLTLRDLERAERVLLVNSVRGWMPARLVPPAPAAGKKPFRVPVEAGGG